MKGVVSPTFLWQPSSMAVARSTAVLPAPVFRQRRHSRRRSVRRGLLAIRAPKLLIFASQTLGMGGGGVSGAFVRNRLFVIVYRHVFRIRSETLDFHGGGGTKVY